MGVGAALMWVGVIWEVRRTPARRSQIQLASIQPWHQLVGRLWYLPAPRHLRLSRLTAEQHVGKVRPSQPLDAD